MAEKWLVVSRSIVHPWLCDSQGHLNTRHHAGIFDEASWLVLGMIAPKGIANEGGFGWVDARHVTEFKREAVVGTMMKVESSLARVGRSSVTIRHRLLDMETSDVFAEFEGVSVAFDLVERSSMPLPQSVRDQAALLFGMDDPT